jgi:hypothetical protein
MPLDYLRVYTLLPVRISLAGLIAILVYFEPYYGLLLASLLVVILTEYNNRISGISNVNRSNFDDTSKYSYEHLKDVLVKRNTAENAININTPQPLNENQLFNEHNLQATSIQGLGGLHKMFITNGNPADNTLTANVEQLQEPNEFYNLISPNITHQLPQPFVSLNGLNPITS